MESVEKISKTSPGEMGKLIGLDRIPEAKTLRNKIKELSGNGQSQDWLNKLSSEWMQMNSGFAGVLYIDGHEKVYSGSQKLPRRFISRLRLSMRGSTDYWVCDRIGQPFFSVNSTANASMIETIKTEIVPRLEQDVPCQPTAVELAADPLLHRFMIVYDRECYSNGFIIDLWEKRVACSTYNKYVKDKWPIEEFCEYEITNGYGETEKIYMAERGVLIEGKESEKLGTPQKRIHVKPIRLQTADTVTGTPPEGPAGTTTDKVKITWKRTKKKKSLWIREVRKLRANGHQTSIQTSNFQLCITLVGVYMFARWCQENFFKYMIKYFGFDMLTSYFTKGMDDTQMLVNPQWRALDKKLRSKRAGLQHKRARYGDLVYNKELEADKIQDVELEKYKQKKAELSEEIEIRSNELEVLKKQKDGIKYKIPFSELPEDAKFEAVYNERKQLVDTLKLIAYRSEVSMVNTVAKYGVKPDKTRSLIAQFFQSNADIEVDNINQRLIIKIHHQPRHADDKILEKLCVELNRTETIFPQTNLRLVYKINNT